MTLPQLELRPLVHRGQETIALLHAETSLNKIIKKLKGARWSQTYKCWYLPLSKESYELLCVSLKNKVLLNTTSLKRYLNQRKSPTSTGASEQKRMFAVPKEKPHTLSAENEQALYQLVQHLKLKAYSSATIRTYRNEFMQLLQLLQHRPVSQLSPDDIRRYMVYAMEQQGIKEHTAHSRLNALKFYFEQVLHRDRFFWEIPRPKKAIDLPRCFSQDEVAAIINHTTNIKHKAMLMLAYSAGLRVSEVVGLLTYEVDSKRMTVLVRQGKGKKDRLVGLSPVLLVVLREYARLYKPDKRGYLFEGAEKGTPYSTRSLQEVIQAAKKKAGVMRPGSIHCLRHSFATHLIDRGTDVTMIQKLLGHNDIKTTLRYLHTSNKDLLKVISPLDDLPLT